VVVTQECINKFEHLWIRDSNIDARNCAMTLRNWFMEWF